MPTALEVIVTSAEEAIEAEAGGADRLELIRDLADGGLTPRQDVIEAVLKAVTLPVRVMLRETATMSAGSPHDLRVLTERARQISNLPIDGLVIGFVENGALECKTVQAIINAAPNTRFTFHRAFDELADPYAAFGVLKRFKQFDRVLTVGGSGAWSQRRDRLIAWQRAAEPDITILVGAGVCPDVLVDVHNTPELLEVHIGRAARNPQDVSGRVTRAAVRSVKSILQ